MALKIAVLCISTLSLFWFPWPVSIGLMVVSGLVFPPFALFLGVVAELVYSISGFPTAFVLGFSIMLLTYAVRLFVKKRII